MWLVGSLAGWLLSGVSDGLVELVIPSSQHDSQPNGEDGGNHEVEAEAVISTETDGWRVDDG
jgi:hypothetical protein